MFPIPWNFPFRKKDGSIGKIEDLGESYSLPTASADTKGGIKVGSGLTMTEETLSANAYTLPTASADTKGGIKVGSGLTIEEDGTLNASGGTNITSVNKPVSTTSGGTSWYTSVTDLIPASKTPVFAVYYPSENASSDYQQAHICLVNYVKEGSNWVWRLTVQSVGGNNVRLEGTVKIYCL